MNNYDKHKNQNSFEEGAKPDSGLRVPNGYFESFEKSILAQIKEETKKVEKPVVPLKSNRNYKRIISVLAVAAALISAIMVFTAPDKVAPTSGFTELEITDWEVYDLDEYALAENFTLEEMDEISFEEDYISNQDIYEYLLEENYSEILLLENL